MDRLFVDEAHGYKNLFLTTKMRNVAGLSTSEAQKSTDMFLKCRYMDELTAGRGVVFDRHPCQQFHDGNVHHAAVFAVRHAEKAEHDAL